MMNFGNKEKNRNIPVYLEPRSAVELTGDSRWNWTHEIPSRKTDRVDGKSIPRGKRISLTFRTYVKTSFKNPCVKISFTFFERLGIKLPENTIVELVKSGHDTLLKIIPELPKTHEKIKESSELDLLFDSGLFVKADKKEVEKILKKDFKKHRLYKYTKVFQIILKRKIE